MIRSRFRSRLLIFLALATASLALGLVPGCGYVLTYDDAFPPQPLDFPRWDPPDSIAFLPVSPPPVEAVILDAYLYYLIHPEGERKAREEANRRPPRPRPRPTEPTSPPDSAAAGAELAGAQVNAASDSTSAADSSSVAHPGPTEEVTVPLPPIQVDLSAREEDVLTRRARVDLERAEILLKVIESEKGDSPQRRERVKSISGFVGQARAALDRRDFQGAANLALKARTLAEAEAEARP